MRTIGRHVPRNHRFDPVVECTVCGLVDYLSRMKERPAGGYACRLDAKGRDDVELSEANAENAANIAARAPFLQDVGGGVRTESEDDE